ncbi:cold-shock protein [Rhizobium paknamense]|uniref:Cold-shock protein n=1 Tax=Rhizobium paknamense TaxID=1206817 RepID=A0ABU0IG67_9HYPH|nr:cold-shock protein [Rhizobium paknamense]MDQ0456246.1 hypothetical protein [Rhizobium paknamense]
MARIRYSPGDTILLKPNLLRNNRLGGAARVVAVLPENQGAAHYRVRFQNENFDRNVSQEDIDSTATPRSGSGSPHPGASGSSWINQNSIRTKK